MLNWIKRKLLSPEGIKDPILDYIADSVEYWPETATAVRLDSDGEICFFTTNESCEYDFFPAKYDKKIFQGPRSIIGYPYSKEQFLARKAARAK